MSGISPYGAPEANGGSGAMTADALVGQLVGSGGTANQVDPRFSPALHSTAPYKPPKTLAQKARESMVENRNGASCAVDDCTAFASNGMEYCVGHAQKLGKVPAEKRCGHDGCKGFKQRGRDFCRWHNE
jgi:hypothetical protein